MVGQTLLLLFFQALGFVHCIHWYPKFSHSSSESDDDPGQPLFLTPYIEGGKIDEARSLARVKFTDNMNITSYSGFFTVNKKYDSNQFVWYFPAFSSNKSLPVLVWLQGGPGATSLAGLFLENGPLRAKEDGTVEAREIHWALNHHIIYIDNPVGTGFSFTNDSRGYCTDETQVGEQLYSTVIQFFKLFPELQQNSFFVTGESYAGKYVPALAHTIHTRNPKADLKINLKGLAIGNGLSDPINQLTVYDKYLYQIGLIDDNGVKYFQECQNKAAEYMNNKQWIEAANVFDKLLEGDFSNGSTTFSNLTGYHFYFNYLYTEDYLGNNFEKVIKNSSFRESIHVGSLRFNDGIEVEKHLKQDKMQSVAPWVSELLDNYMVLLYSGQLDIIVAYPLTVNYLRKLNFSESETYKNAPRHVWKVDGEVAGYVKHAIKGNHGLVEVLVRNAGHMVPTDQPKFAHQMITLFTSLTPKSSIETNVLKPFF